MPVPDPHAAVVVAAAAYAANCALGGAVASGLIDTSRNRWAHHVLYIVTTTLTVAAVAGSLAQRSARGVVLAPALLPLALLPFAGHRRHVRTAVAAAPWYAGALLAGGR